MLKFQFWPAVSTASPSVCLGLVAYLADAGVPLALHLAFALALLPLLRSLSQGHAVVIVLVSAAPQVIGLELL